MSTAYEKELAAGSLRYYAGLVEDALDSLPALSAEAWDCPAADAFVDGARAEDASLTGAAATMRSVATALDNAAAAQRAAEAARGRRRRGSRRSRPVECVLTMRVVVSAADGQRDVELRPSDDARIGDLELLFEHDTDDPVSIHVDGRPVDPDSPLQAAGIGAGSVLSLERADPPAEGVCELRVLAGPGAGSAVVLPPGRFVLGSGPDADIAYRAPGVRPRHGEIRVDATGAVTLQGPDRRPVPVIPAALLRVGAGLVTFGRIAGTSPDLRAMPGRRGTVSFNRPPRRMPVRPRTSIAYPEMPRPPSGRARLSVVAFIVPLLFGVAMAILIHPRMAFFALLGPVMMVGNWLEDRRRNRKFRRETAEHLDSGLEQLGLDLDRAAAEELVHRRSAYPDVAELRRWPGGSSRMWERRPTHPDFMQLVAGYGRARWHPPMSDAAGEVPAEFRALVAMRAVLPPTVVPIDLRPGQVAGIAGSRQAGLDMVRGLLCQAAILHGPADMQIAVVTDHPADWDWAKWLPHTIADAASGRRLLASAPEDRARLVTLLMGSAPGAAASGVPGRPGGAETVGEAATLLVVDVGDLEQPSGMGLRQLLGGAGAAVSGLVIASSPRELPSTCTWLRRSRRTRRVSMRQTVMPQRWPSQGPRTMRLFTLDAACRATTIPIAEKLVRNCRHRSHCATSSAVCRALRTLRHAGGVPGTTRSWLPPSG